MCINKSIRKVNDFHIGSIVIVHRSGAVGEISGFYNRSSAEIKFESGQRGWLPLGDLRIPLSIEEVMVPRWRRAKKRRLIDIVTDSLEEGLRRRRLLASCSNSENLINVHIHEEKPREYITLLFRKN